MAAIKGLSPWLYVMDGVVAVGDRAPRQGRRAERSRPAVADRPRAGRCHVSAVLGRSYGAGLAGRDDQRTLNLLRAAFLPATYRFNQMIRKRFDS